MAFDFQGAMKAGYSPAEIADYVGSQSGFDVGGARKAGYTDDEILGHLGFKKPETTRTAFAVANDTVIEAANAAAGFVGSIANFLSPGNKVSKFIDKEIIQAGEEKQSDVTKASKAKFREEMAAADTVGGEVKAVGNYIVENPLLAAAQAAGSFAGPGLAIKGAQGAAALAGATGKAVGRAGTAAGIATGGAAAGGDAAGNAYDLIQQADINILSKAPDYQELAAMGMSEPQIRDVIGKAAARDASILPAIIGGVGGAFGAEKILALGKQAGKSVIKTALAEGAQEGIEEGVTQYQGQRAAAEYDPTIDPMKGVAGASAMGAAMGGPTGGAVHMLAGHEADTLKNIADAPDVDSAIAAAVAGNEVAPLALPNYAGPAMHVFPDGSAMTGAEAEQYRLDQMKQPVQPDVGIPASTVPQAPQGLPNYAGPTLYVHPDESTTTGPEAQRLHALAAQAAEQERFAAVANPQPADPSIDPEAQRQAEIDAAYAQRETDEAGRLEAQTRLALEQKGEQQLEQAQTFTQALGFDTPEPTAMQLAMQAARDKAQQKTQRSGKLQAVAVPANLPEQRNDFRNDPEAQNEPVQANAAVAAPSVEGQNPDLSGSAAPARLSPDNGVGRLPEVAEINEFGDGAPVPLRSRNDVPLTKEQRRAAEREKLERQRKSTNAIVKDSLTVEPMRRAAAEKDRAKLVAQKSPPHDRPMAAKGLISYRYKGRHGWIMIGAKDNADALSEAKRSFSDKNESPELAKLEVWDGEKYVSTENTSAAPVKETPKNEQVAKQDQTADLGQVSQQPLAVSPSKTATAATAPKPDEKPQQKQPQALSKMAAERIARQYGDSAVVPHPTKSGMYAVVPTEEAANYTPAEPKPVRKEARYKPDLVPLSDYVADQRANAKKNGYTDWTEDDTAGATDAHRDILEAALERGDDVPAEMLTGHEDVDAKAQPLLAGKLGAKQKALFSRAGARALEKSGPHFIGRDMNLVLGADMGQLKAFHVAEPETGEVFGQTTLIMDEDGYPTVLAYIKSYTPGQGERILKNILATAPDGLYIDNMLPEAVGFWKKMGTVLADGSTEWEHGNGILTQEAFDQARARKGEAAGTEAGRRRQDREEIREASEEEAGARSPSVTRVETWLAESLAKLKNIPKVNIVADESALPPAPNMSSEGGKIEGAFLDGEIYLVANNLPTKKRAIEVLAHEAVGHLSLEQMLDTHDPKLMPRLVRQVQALKGNKYIAELSEIVEKRQPKLDEESHAKEILALIAERGDDVKEMGEAVRSLWRRIMDGIRAFFKLTFNNDLTDQDVRDIVASARRWAEGEEHITAAVKGKPRTLYSKAGEESRLDRARGRWNEAIDGYKKGWLKPGQNVRIDPSTPNVLLEVGAPDLPLYVGQDIIAKVLGGKHQYGVTEETLRKSLDSIYEPLMVFESATEPNSLVILSEFQDRAGNAVVIPIRVDRNVDRTKANIVVSVYGRESSQAAFNGWAERGLLKYADQKKIAALSTRVRLQLPYLVQSAQRSGQSVLSEEDVVKKRGALYSRAPAEEAVETDRTEIIGDSGRPYDAAQRAAFARTGRTLTKKSVKEQVAGLWQDAGKKMAQGIVDQFVPVREISQKAYTLLRLSKGSTGAFEALMKHGKLKIEDGAYDATNDGGVLDKVFYPLGKESSDFLYWVAGNRAEKLAQEGRENLFSPEDISAYKSLDSGTTDFDYTLENGKTTRDRTLIYRDSMKKFNEFNKNVLDMAEQSGLIDGGSRKLWESEFYVPFYRVADEQDGGVRGMNIRKGVVRQEAFKKLKGGTEGLNDLLANTMMNWAHLIDASAKNRAAKETLEAAERFGSARKAEPGEKKTVWFMDKGQKVEYKVDDPYLLAALNGLEYAGLQGPAMKALTSFKHWLTIGVTSSPFFKIRNLVRDSIQSIAVSDLSYNPVANINEGIKLTDRAGQEYVSALAGGGLIRFGTMLEGNEASRTRKLIQAGAKEATILNSPSKIRAFYDGYLEPAISAYNELGNRGEEINRMTLFAQLKKQGVDHATANLMARDLMDFSMQGAWTSIRFLTQTVPFLNARLQGLYKLGRSAKERPAKMAAVTGAVTLVSLGLLAAYGDDDDWKKREEWDRDNYWWFKFGGIAYRVPKPFEIGAVATLAERTAELLFDDEMTGKRFRSTVSDLLVNQLAMNPVPQTFKPIIDLYANKDSFTGRPIESMGMERLEPQYRFRQSTSAVARGVSTVGNAVTDGNFLSPVQIDHLVRGYFSWLGAFVVGGADMAIRAMSDEPTRPTVDYFKLATGGIVSKTEGAASRYVTQMYDQAKELEEAYGTWRNLIKTGKTEEAREYREDNKEKLLRYKSVEGVKKVQSKLNEQIKIFERSNMDPDTKRVKINQLKDRQNQTAKVLSRRIGE